MKYIFIIGTEHQLFQVHFAIKEFKINYSEVILVLFELDNDSFLNKNIKLDLFPCIYSFKNWTFKDLFLSRKQINIYINFCKNLKKSDFKCTLFTSHYDSDPDLLFLSIVKPNFYFLMDEGTASFSVVYKRNNISIDVFKYCVKSILYGHSIKLPRKVTFFTQYKLNHLQIDKSYIYKIIKKTNPLIEFSYHEAIVLGTSIVELGILKQNDYFKILTELHKKIELQHIFYFPHRKENKNKLEQIKSLGYIIESHKEPFESYFAKLKKSPVIIAAPFFSGTLDNIAKSNTVIPTLIMYNFDIKLLSKPENDVFKCIGKQMERNEDLKFIDIEIKL